jgi:hypothetical protein
LPIQLRRCRLSPALASWKPLPVCQKNRGSAVQQNPPIFANPKGVNEGGVLADYPSDYNGEIGGDIIETTSLEH